MLSHETKDGIEEYIEDAQIKAGDIAGAQKTVDLFQGAGYKSTAQKVILETETRVRLPIPLIKVRDWIEKLDDDAESKDFALNTAPFLDLASYLKTLPPADDSPKLFDALVHTAFKIVNAQNAIGRMLKQEIGK